MGSTMLITMYSVTYILVVDHCHNTLLGVV